MIERATPIETSPAPPAFEDLLRTVAEMDTPDGFKAELIRGKIVVSPFSRLRYSRPMRLLREQLQSHVPDGCFADTSSPHGYRARTTVSFGEPLHIPAPFDFTLDTTI
ncbi:hypothetical protein [Streptomyces sp. NRRL F-4428]|uniref:hypothetical protein n=1 Tax=Streptomyces sp. NRRL F-4428 TaxID=1609137 RepID=UPI001F3AA710|nr:hypothetical protein [Streptomyces sp. NRRL F-4428]